MIRFKEVLALVCTIAIATVLEPCAHANGGGLSLGVRAGGLRQRSVVRTRSRGSLPPAVVQQSYYVQPAPVVLQQRVKFKQAPAVLQSSFYAQPAPAVLYQQPQQLQFKQQYQLQQFQQYQQPLDLQQGYCAPQLQQSVVPGCY